MTKKVVSLEDGSEIYWQLTGALTYEHARVKLLKHKLVSLRPISAETGR